MHKCNLMSSYRVPFRTFFHVLKLTWFLSFRQRFRKKESSLYKVIQPRTGKIRGGNLGKCNFSSLRNSFGRKRIFFFFSRTYEILIHSHVVLAFPINISRLHNLQSAITDGNSLRRKVARSFSSTFYLLWSCQLGLLIFRRVGKIFNFFHGI